jgi:hypothetical protein
LKIEFREKVDIGSMRPSRPPPVDDLVGDLEAVADSGAV